MTYKPFPYLLIDTEPTSEPISLDEAKSYLRVDSDEENDFIAQLIITARLAAEKFTKRSLITQTWLLTFDGCAPTETFLPRGPVQSITSVKIVARDTTETTLSSSGYYLNAGKEKLVFDTTPIGHIVEIHYVTGFGAATEVPHEIKQGMLAHIAELFDKRSEASVLPETSRNLYSNHRVINL